jgi:hypothetical protein
MSEHTVNAGKLRSRCQQPAHTLSGATSTPKHADVHSPRACSWFGGPRRLVQLHATMAIVLAGCGQKEIPPEPPAKIPGYASIAGMVTTATGAPVVGRQIAFRSCAATYEKNGYDPGPFFLASSQTDARGSYLIRAVRRAYPNAAWYRYRCFATVSPDSAIFRDSLLVQFADDSVGAPLQTFNIIVR